MKRISRAMGVAVAGATVAVGILVPATAASAAPGGCTEKADTGNSYTVSCTRGSGRFRAVAKCYRINRPTGSYVPRYGAWARPSGVSTAYCQSSEEVGGGYRDDE